MAARVEPFVEPWTATARRTGLLALAIGVGIGLYERQLAGCVVATFVALWFTFGGHLVEILFRNHLRQHVVAPTWLIALLRVVYWFASGSVLYAGALTTRAILTGQQAVPWPWWIGGVGFVGLEFVVHLAMRARDVPSFYDGRG